MTADPADARDVSTVRGRRLPAIAGKVDAASEVARLRQRIGRLEAERARLREARRSAERFASAAAHELCDPLVVVQRSADMLEEEFGEQLDPYVRSRLRSLSGVAARARLTAETLLHDALSAEHPPEVTEVDLASVVADAVTLVADRGTRIPPRIAVGSLPTVTTSRSLLLVVMRNLLANAVKYASPAAGEIRVSSVRDGAGWRLEVVSPGAAISRPEARRILGRFERGVQAAGVSGTGLGLDICDRLVRRLGGRLGVAPQRGVGNSFFVWLPDPVSSR